MRGAWNGTAFWRLQLNVLSFCRRYINFGEYQRQLVNRVANTGRRNYRSTNHILFALSYAAVSSTTDNNELVESKQVQCYNPVPDQIEELKWEKVTQDDSVCVYRRWIASIGVYEYRCAGSYKDISAENFVKAQMDIDYRKKWDPNVLCMETLEMRDEGTEVLKWVHKFPRPMSARIYVYLRRTIFDAKAQSMQIDSIALSETEWPSDPVDKSYVRVTTYKSQLTLYAHSQYEENGFDYVLTYYDHPKASLPGPAYNWIVNYGGFYFLKDVHAAAKRLASMKTDTSTN